MKSEIIYIADCAFAKVTSKLWISLAPLRFLQMWTRRTSAHVVHRGGAGELLFVGRNRFDLLVEISADAFARLKEDNVELGAIGQIDCRGVIVTAVGTDENIDFESRFFGPRAGVPEDPVTGTNGPVFRSKVWLLQHFRGLWSSV